jgi:hypothetical protein
MMPRNPVQNARRIGALRVPSNVDVAGPADELATLVTVSDTGVMHRKNNNGTVVHQVLGDGRHVLPILAAPAGTAAGQFVLEDSGGITYLAYVDSGGTKRLIQPTSTAFGPTALVDATPTLVDTFALSTTVEWLLDFNLTTAVPEQHTACRVMASVYDATTVRWSIYGETDAFDHVIDVTYAAGSVSLIITADGTDYEATVNRFVMP